MQFRDRIAQYPNRVRLIEVATGEETVYDIIRDEGDITDEGTSLNADNLNAITSDLQNELLSARPIGEWRSGIGNIARNGSGWNNLTSGLRFNCFLNGTYLGNRNWRIQGSGSVFGTTWTFVQGNISTTYIGQILGLGADFFVTSQEINNGTWFSFNSSTGTFDATRLGYGGVVVSPNQYPQDIGLARIHNNIGTVGPWEDSNCLIQGYTYYFDFVLRSTQD